MRRGSEGRVGCAPDLVPSPSGQRLLIKTDRSPGLTLTTTIVNGRRYLDSYSVNPAWFNVPEW